MRKSKSIIADDFAAAGTAQRLPHRQSDRVRNEVNAAVAQDGVDAAGMSAAGGQTCWLVGSHAVGDAAERGDALAVAPLAVVPTLNCVDPGRCRERSGPPRLSRPSGTETDETALVVAASIMQ